MPKPKVLKPEWKPVSVAFDDTKYEYSTVGRVKGWGRLAYLYHSNGTWSLNCDPAIEEQKDSAIITHWLAVPRFSR